MKHNFRLFPFAIVGILSIPLAASAVTHTREIDREFSASEFEKLAVHLSAGRINAVTGNDSIIRIEIDLETKVGSVSEADELFDKTEVLFNESGKDLSLVIKKLPRKGFFSFFSRNRNRVIASVKVFVPRDFDLHLNTGSGGIEVDGLLGNIVLDTGSGSIQGRNLTGDIVADTGSGQIRFSDVEGNLEADTGSGNIQLTGMNGEFVADTGSGSVNASGDIHRFRIDTGSGSIKVQSFVEIKEGSTADTGSGGIRLQLPQSSGFILDADVGSGHIDCSFPLQDVQQKKNSLKAVANDGGSRIRLDSGSGSIIVQPNP